MKVRKDSNLLALGRFGIGALIAGVILMPFAVIAVQRFPNAGNAWLALTLSVTMIVGGLLAFVYGWWLDQQAKRQHDGEIVQ